MQRNRQPPGPIALKTTGLAKGIIASFDAWPSPVDASVLAGSKGDTSLSSFTPWTPLSSAVNRATPAGAAALLTGTVASYSIAVNCPTAKTSPWTMAVVHRPSAQLVRSQLFGFGFQYNSGSPTTALESGVANNGQYRGILNFNSNYYFWGSSADWDTGIAWDTDGRTHVIVFVSDGTNITLWRDGVSRASSAVPAGLVSTPTGRLVIAGSYLSTGTASPSTDLISGRIWNRALTAPEIVAYSRNSWQVFPDVSPLVLADTPAAAGGFFSRHYYDRNIARAA